MLYYVSYVKKKTHGKADLEELLEVPGKDNSVLPKYVALETTGRAGFYLHRKHLHLRNWSDFSFSFDISGMFSTIAPSYLLIGCFRVSRGSSFGGSGPAHETEAQTVPVFV